MDLKAIWQFNYKKVIISYLIIFSTFSIIEIILTKSFSYTFIISYLSLFFIAPYFRRALNEFFKNLHIKKVFRNLITSWLIFGIIFLYVNLFFISDLLPNVAFDSIQCISIPRTFSGDFRRKSGVFSYSEVSSFSDWNSIL